MGYVLAVIQLEESFTEFFFEPYATKCFLQTHPSYYKQPHTDLNTIPQIYSWCYFIDVEVGMIPCKTVNSWMQQQQM